MAIDHATMDFRPNFCPMCKQPVPLQDDGKVVFYEGKPYICAGCQTEIVYQFPIESTDPNTPETDTDR